MTGIVLAGGESQRMGRPKALVQLGGQTLVERAALRLGELCRQVMVAASPDLLLPPLQRCLVVRDEQPGLGPLAGIIAGLSASDDEWHLVLACDLPLARPEVLHLLAERAGRADAVVPHARGRLQPLLAAYSCRCLGPGREALRLGRRAVAAMLDQVRVEVVPEAELEGVDPELESFFNLNTWEDYAAVCEREKTDAPAW